VCVFRGDRLGYQRRAVLLKCSNLVHFPVLGEHGVQRIHCDRVLGVVNLQARREGEPEMRNTGSGQWDYQKQMGHWDSKTG
jgi:hypothetical protein